MSQEWEDNAPAPAKVEEEEEEEIIPLTDADYRRLFLAVLHYIYIHNYITL